jgi:hypothetical protein
VRPLGDTHISDSSITGTPTAGDAHITGAE